MRYNLIDQIVEVQPFASIKAVKSVALTEEYLGDHFPGFPVMPGALMLEAMTQAGAWLIRLSEDFAHSMVVVRRATNIRYGRFVRPGQTLTVEAEVYRQDEFLTTLTTRGSVEGQSAVNARLVLHRYNLADRDPGLADKDNEIIRGLRTRLSVIYKPARVGMEASVG